MKEEEATEEYLELFDEKEPIPIYRVSLSKLNVGNAVLAWFRKKAVGVKGAGEYRHVIGLPEEIRILEGMPEEIEREIVRHEVNHYQKGHLTEMGVPEYIMISGALLVIPGMFRGVPTVLAQVGTLVALAGFLLQSSQHEQEANEDVDLSEAYDKSSLDLEQYSDSYLSAMGYAESVLGLALIPLSGLVLGMKGYGSALTSLVSKLFGGESS